jgi:hypothetical protein
MNTIQGLIEKLREKIFEKTPDSSRIALVLSKELGVLVAEKNLSLRNNRLTCMVSPVVKSEIMLRKKELLKLLEEVTPKGSIQEIC